MEQLHKELEIVNALIVVCKRIMADSQDDDIIELNGSIVELLLKKFEVNET